MRSNFNRLELAAATAFAALLVYPLSSAMAGSEKPTGPQTMECVEIVAQAMLGPDLECNIAYSHHRMEEYPEAVFFCDLPEADCSDPDNPCAVKGKIVGIMGDHDFVAGVACGFTVNELGEEAAEDLGEIGYQQFTARTNMRVFLDTTEIPVPPPGTDEVKADFGLFLGDAGVARPDFYVSQSMTLTGTRKLPEGTKGNLNMSGVPPVRTVTGTLCGPNLSDKLNQIAKKEKSGENWEEQD